MHKTTKNWDKCKTRSIFFQLLKTIKCVYFSIWIFLERFYFVIYSQIDTSDFLMSLFKWREK